MMSFADALFGAGTFTSAMIKANQQQAEAALQFWRNVEIVPGRAPGVYWERTGGKTLRVTIVREQEYQPTYGRSPAMEALPAMRDYNALPEADRVRLSAAFIRAAEGGIQFGPPMVTSTFGKPASYKYYKWLNGAYREV